MSRFLDIALGCVRRGWYVFPCKPNTKQPFGALVPNGALNASNDPEQLNKWWVVAPDANVAIATGPSGLTVLDCDHGLASLADFEQWALAAALPPTYTVRTGRRDSYGVQRYYCGPQRQSIAWKVNGYEGDIRSESGYVMAAGCVHDKTGELYEVICDVPIVPAPRYVYELKSSAKDKSTDDGGPIEHHRNVTLTSIAGKLRNAGLSQAAIELALLQVNADRCVPPLDDAEVLEIGKHAGAWPLPETEPIVTLGAGKNMQPEAARPPERVRPVYPIAAWEGTVVAEFAKLCADDNHIPRKMYAEAFRCALGAVVGDRISCPAVEGALPRTYTVIVAPKGKGKGTAIRRAVKFFSQPWYGTRPTGGMTIQGDASGLLSGCRDFVWKPKGIGAWVAAASSVPGMARLTKDQDSTIKNKPHLTWGNTLSRILSVHEEMKTFLSALFIEGGVGSGLEGVICQLWDDVSFHGTATGTRDAAYGEMMFSLLAAVTEQDWFDLLSRGNAVGSGLMSRFNLIGTEGQFENVSRMKPPDLTKLHETFLPRVVQLEDAHARVTPSEAANKIISEWADNLPEGSERMNVHAWRSALLLAWLRHEDAITAKTAEDAVRLGQYQMASHDYYRPKSADTPLARVQAKIARALEMKGPLTKRDLQRQTNANRDGTELWNRALAGLVGDKSVGTREDGRYYRAE